MDKSEFITELSAKEPSYNMSYESREGFKQCKKMVLEMAQNLDIQGLSVESFKLFKDTLNDLNKTYNSLFELQRELFLERETNIRLISELQEEKTRNYAAIKLIKSKELMPQYDEMLKAEQEIFNKFNGGNNNV